MTYRAWELKNLDRAALRELTAAIAEQVAGFRIMLDEFLLRHGNNVLIAVENDRPGTGGSLVQ